MQLGQLFDVENVEVLRGPQGGGSGRNASAGAIRVYSRKPTGELAAELRSSLGNYGLMDFEGELAAELRSSLGNYGLMDFEGALEIPLVEETLATRLAFRFMERDPTGKNGCGGSPPSQYQEGKPQTGGLPMIPLDPGPDGVFGPNPQGVVKRNPNVPPIPFHILDPPPGPNDDTGRTDTGERGVTGGENARIYDGEKFCGETPVFVQNPDYFVLPTTNREDPQGFLVSRVPSGLPAEVNDRGNWAARGQLRFQPPGTDMDWLLNAHGSRLDQLSTLGQAMGTANDYLGGRSGGDSGGGYREPDHKEMAEDLWEAAGYNTTDYSWDPALTQEEIEEAKKLVPEKLSKELARNLDIRPRRGDYNRVGQTRLDAWGAFLRGDWSIGPVAFTSISGYDTYDRFREEDQDFSPEQYFEAISQDDAWQFSQELRLGAELADTPLRWEAGGYYLMEQLHASVDQFIITPEQRPYREYQQDLWSFGHFAGFGWDFLDDFTLEGGFRYNWERKKFDFTLMKPELNPPVTNRLQDSRTWQAPTGTISLSYRFGEDSSVYWKYSRGWKGGHFNASANVDKGITPAEPETIDAFEAGLRGRWLDGRLGLGLALFYYGYTNYQVFVIEDEPGAPPTLAVINAKNAEVYGAELDLRAEPLAGWVPHALDGLVLTGRLGWLESQFLDFTRESFRRRLVGWELRNNKLEAITEDIPLLIDYSGNRLLNSPRLKASLAAEWTLDLGRWGALIPRYDFAWTDDIFFDPSEGLGSPNEFGEFALPEYTTGQRAYWLHGVRLAYRTPAGNIEIAFWVRNLTDKVYKTFAFDASTFSNIVVNFVGEPRTYGGSISISW
jgi:outer membrane receptor protein involved in Fe transport